MLAKRTDLLELFSRQTNLVSDETFAVAKHLRRAFSIVASVDPEEVDEDEDDTPTPRGLIRIRYNFSDVDVRRVVTGFVRT